MKYPLTKNIDSLKYYLPLTGRDTDRVNVMNGLAWQYCRRDPDTAITIERNSLSLATQLDFKTGIARAEHNIGYALSLKGDYDSAITYVNEAQQLFISTGFINGQLSANNTLGGIYDQRGEYDKAIDCYFKAEEIAEKMNNLNGQMACLSNIGLIYTSKGNYNQALGYFRKCLLLTKGKNKSIATTCLVNLGDVFGRMGIYDSALFYNNEALANKTAAGDKNGMSTCYLNNAQVYVMLNDLAKAQENNAKAYELETETGDQRGSAITLISMAQVEKKKGNSAAALNDLQRSEQIAHNIGSQDVLLSVYDELSHVYAAKGDYRNAYESHLVFSQINDSVLGEKSDKNISELQTKFETVKKDKAIAELTKDKTISDALIEKKNNEAKRRFQLLMFALAVLVFVIGFAIFIFFSLRRNQRLNRILGQKNALIEEKNKSITDSINYARRIQRAMLTSESYLQKFLPEFFIFNRPKDIVSGDFYWAVYLNGKLFFMTADCTGHGVPGAFMSLIGVSFLNEIVIEKNITDPGKILDQLRDEIIHALNPEENEMQDDGSSVMDGMDCVLCVYDLKEMELHYAAANNPLWIVRNGMINVYAANKMPVGKYEGEKETFGTGKVKLVKGDTVFTFTDGFADQFGGPQGKKFKYKQLGNLLSANANLPMPGQKKILEHTFENWKSYLEQVDDVLVIGVKV